MHCNECVPGTLFPYEFTYDTILIHTQKVFITRHEPKGDFQGLIDYHEKAGHDEELTTWSISACAVSAGKTGVTGRYVTFYRKGSALWLNGLKIYVHA